MNYKKFRLELTLSTNYIETEHTTVDLLKEVFPKSLVGLEVMYVQLPPNLKGKTALKYKKKLAKEQCIDHDAAHNLNESASKVTYKPSAQGCTMLFQVLQGIQHQLKEPLYDASLEKLELTPYKIIHYVFK